VRRLCPSGARPTSTVSPTGFGGATSKQMRVLAAHPDPRGRAVFSFQSQNSYRCSSTGQSGGFQTAGCGFDSYHPCALAPTRSGTGTLSTPQRTATAPALAGANLGRGRREPVCFGSRRHRVRLAGPRRVGCAGATDRWSSGYLTSFSARRRPVRSRHGLRIKQLGCPLRPATLPKWRDSTPVSRSRSGIGRCKPVRVGPMAPRATHRCAVLPCKQRLLGSIPRLSTM
jgi:hypothetical protein